MQDLQWEATKKNFNKIIEYKQVAPLITERKWSPIFKYEVKKIVGQTLKGEEDIKKLQRSLGQ